MQISIQKILQTSKPPEQNDKNNEIEAEDKNKKLNNEKVDEYNAIIEQPGRVPNRWCVTMISKGIKPYGQEAKHLRHKGQNVAN